MKISTASLKNFFLQKKILIPLLILVIGGLLYTSFFQQAVIGPLAERTAHARLEEIKQKYELGIFESDGCSGNVSNGWSTAVDELSMLSPIFAERYSEASNIPFEFACATHDRAYHEGNGGYTGRLEADNVLRNTILAYGIHNTEEIKERTGLKTDEEATFLYEIVAEAVYNGVRIGGAPCTGMSYAWGFGYNSGQCD